MRSGEPEVSLKRFDIALFVVHPSIDPSEIDVALELDAQYRQRAGEQRRTSDGTLSHLLYLDTRWRYVERYHTQSQHFAQRLTDFVNACVRHKIFIADLTSTGGSLQLVVDFLGDGYLGDTVPTSTLATMAELKLGLGIEVFTVQQN